jgi:DnaK suppressor protein
MGIPVDATTGNLTGSVPQLLQSEDEAPRTSQPVASLRTIGGNDALIALQGQDEGQERRRRAVGRGKVALDVLDELKVELLSGTLEPSTLLRLKSVGTDLLDGSGDPRLDAVLAEIELRLAVEIAKLPPASPQIASFSGHFSGPFSPLVGCERPHYKLAPRAGRLVEFGWGQMKNKNGNKVIGAIKRSNGIKGVNGGTGAKGLNGSHVNGSHPGNGAVAGADKKNYRPTEKEPFMNERQRDYFRERLLSWREDILKEAKETLQHLQDENQNHPDLADRASSETDRAIELRARDRQRKVINKIDAALARIEDGTYGYCEETGEPIALKRLEARPIATLSVEAQERHERRERVYRDD